MNEIDIELWQPQIAELKQILNDEPEHAFIHARDLAARSGFPTKGTQAEMRQVIAQLIEKQDMPIISTAHGYAIADQPGQIQRCIDDFMSRQEGIQRRIEALQRIKDTME